MLCFRVIGSTSRETSDVDHLRPGVVSSRMIDSVSIGNVVIAVDVALDLVDDAPRARAEVAPRIITVPISLGRD